MKKTITAKIIIQTAAKTDPKFDMELILQAENSLNLHPQHSFEHETLGLVQMHYRFHFESEKI